MNESIGSRLFLLISAAAMLCGSVACVPNPPTADATATDATEPWDWPEERVRAAVNQVRAGRDLNPDSWPGGARVAVLLSFDVDNETVQGFARRPGEHWSVVAR